MTIAQYLERQSRLIKKAEDNDDKEKLIDLMRMAISVLVERIGQVEKTL